MIRKILFNTREINLIDSSDGRIFFTVTENESEQSIAIQMTNEQLKTLGLTLVAVAEKRQ